MNSPFPADRGARTPFPLDLGRIARGEVDDGTIRAVLRIGLASELRRLSSGGAAAQLAQKLALVHELASSPITSETVQANEQHYEVPSEFFRLVLGHRLKYSCAYWHETADLDAAEDAMLDLVCRRARIEDGQSILDLGCGWGSLTLYLAEHYPNSTVLSLSNSLSQKSFIENEALERGLTNVSVECDDIAHWDTSRKFQRIISVEMFEHARNYKKLLHKVAHWMTSDALLFVHIFSHRQHAYLVSDNWMADNFFSGGIMPSTDLLLYFQDDLTIADQWCVDGTHYQRTCEAWLSRLDERRDRALAILEQHYGKDPAIMALASWRLFFLACAEIFGFGKGQEWMISHHLLRKRSGLP